jgi:hypothetical protein
MEALSRDPRAADGCLPPFPADADGKAARLALGRKIIEPQLCQIYDDAARRRIRQHELRRQREHPANARQPRVHARIRCPYLHEPQIICPGDVEHRVVSQFEL